MILKFSKLLPHLLKILGERKLYQKMRRNSEKLYQLSLKEKLWINTNDSPTNNNRLLFFQNLTILIAFHHTVNNFSIVIDHCYLMDVCQNRLIVSLVNVCRS